MNKQSVLSKFNYKLPEIERCCKNCAFYSNSGMLDGKHKCTYVNEILSCKDIWIGLNSFGSEIHEFGCCDHFISMKDTLSLFDCRSKDEFSIKKDIFNIEINDLLLVELLDGFHEYEKATTKMMKYAIKIHSFLVKNDMSDLNKSRTALPLEINLEHLGSNGSIWNIEISNNFSRINAYIKNHVDEFKSLSMKCYSNQEKIYYRNIMNRLSVDYSDMIQSIESSLQRTM